MAHRDLAMDDSGPCSIIGLLECSCLSSGFGQTATSGFGSTSATGGGGLFGGGGTSGGFGTSGGTSSKSGDALNALVLSITIALFPHRLFNFRVFYPSWLSCHTFPTSSRWSTRQVDHPTIYEQIHWRTWHLKIRKTKLVIV